MLPRVRRSTSKSMIDHRIRRRINRTTFFLIILFLHTQSSFAFFFVSARRSASRPLTKNGKSSAVRQGSKPIATRHGIVRGGGDSDSFSNDDAVDSNHRRRGMSFTLASVYFTVMGAKCALPATLSLLTATTTGLSFSTMNGTPQQAFRQLFFWSTLAVAGGKLVLGPLIDHLGGILSLKIALTTLALNLMVIANCQSFSTFCTSWIFVDFIFSSCWAACINAIHQSFPSREWAQQVSTIAASSRLGNAMAFVMFASLLQYFAPRTQQAWRPIFLISSLVQFIPVLLLTIFGKEKNNNNVNAASANAVSTPSLSSDTATTTSKKPSFQNTLTTLRREMVCPDFWLHLISRSALMVFASFLLFVPSLLTKVYGASPAKSARIGSLYAIGCLLSVTTGSKVYARLSKRSKVSTIIGMLGMATLSSVLQLGHMKHIWTLSLTASAISFFLWGLSFAIPFYIPPSLYALQRGGIESSATIADIFDVVGFGWLACFNGYVAGIAQDIPSAWIPTFVLTTACSLSSLVALTVATLREPKKNGVLA